jgi:hypothetical protein
VVLVALTQAVRSIRIAGIPIVRICLHRSDDNVAKMTAGCFGMGAPPCGCCRQVTPRCFAKDPAPENPEKHVQLQALDMLN